MALYLTSINFDMTAQELVTIVNSVNRFHQLHPAADSYEDDCTAILLVLDRILNPLGFQATITLNNTIIMVLMD